MKLKLIGITGDFLGNEERLHFCFPIFEDVEDEKRVRGVALSANWSIDDRSTWDLIAHNVDISSIGTEVDVEQPILIEEGTIVGIVGSKFFERLDILDICNARHRWYQMNNGFRIFIDSYDNYKELSRKIAEDAVKVFDEELIKARSCQISNRAENAGGIITYSSYLDFISCIVRILVMKWVKHDDEGLQRTLVMASIRSGEPGKMLEERMNNKIKSYIHDYLENRPRLVLGFMTTRLPRPNFSHARR